MPADRRPVPPARARREPGALRAGPAAAALAGLALAGVLLLCWWVFAPPAGEAGDGPARDEARGLASWADAASSPAPRAVARSVHPPAGPAATPDALLATATTAAGRAASSPAGLTASQWQAISARIDPGPGHDAEMARIGALLEDQRRVARLRDLRDATDPASVAERRALAVQLDAGLEGHLALREITGPEAVQLKTAVLADLAPDPAQRAQRLQAWQQAWSGAHPPAVADPRVADYQRQEAAVVADWQSRPAAQRDPAELARRLQRLQVAVFNPGP